MPVAIASAHIQSWSNPGDVILDPFAGSGTTLKAAKELNRQWCGIEINPEYCAIAEARLSQDVLQLETCPMRPNNRI
jgi:site-specific DNA-methyltransferase (adenine-specific)